jgi:hypothetical protein
MQLATIGVDMEPSFKHCIVDLLDAGYSASVYDDGELIVKASIDLTAILAAMATTSKDWLYVCDRITGERVGWVRFILGNNGPDVIRDYTANLEPVLTCNKSAPGKIAPLST